MGDGGREREREREKKTRRGLSNTPLLRNDSEEALSSVAFEAEAVWIRSWGEGKHPEPWKVPRVLD